LRESTADESLKDPWRNGIITGWRSGEQEREDKQRVGEAHESMVSHSDSASSCDDASICAAFCAPERAPFIKKVTPRAPTKTINAEAG
jgi:hypothetical protein